MNGRTLHVVRTTEMGPRALVLALLPTAVAANKGVTVTQIVGGSAAVLWDIKYKKSLYYFGHPLRFAC